MQEIQKLVKENYILGKSIGAIETYLKIRDIILHNVDIDTYIKLLPFIEKAIEDYKREIALESIN